LVLVEAHWYADTEDIGESNVNVILES